MARRSSTRGTVSCGAVILMFLFIPALVLALPLIEVDTDWEDYVAGDAIKLSVLAYNTNYDQPVTADVYVGLICEDRPIYTMRPSGWDAGIEPWLSNVTLPPRFRSGWIPISYMGVPNTMPPIAEKGEYLFAAAMASPGTLEPASAIAFASIEIVDEPGSRVYVNGRTGNDSNDGSSGSPFKTVTRALGAVEGSEATPVTIRVAKGEYTASANGEIFPLNMKSWVSLKGSDSATTILDAEREALHVIQCESVTNLTIERFTITRGEFKPVVYPLNAGGGGIYCHKSSPTIQDNIISENLSEEAGGGIRSLYGSPVILDNTILNNVAMFGGGINIAGNETVAIIQENRINGNFATMCGGGIHCGTPARISGNTICDNLSSGPAGGGGIYMSFGSPMVEGNTIMTNMAKGPGGGITCDGSYRPIRGNLIVGNLSGEDGGGINIDGTVDSVEGNIIVGNLANHSGGGINAGDGSGAILNNLIVGNLANNDGGGIYCNVLGCPPLINNTIAFNSALNDGGGIYCDTGTYHPPGRKWVLTDCIIWGNGDDLYDCAGTFCCIEDDDPGEGNIHLDPIFTARYGWDEPFFYTGPETARYYLDPESPCIDAGSMSAQEAGLADRTTQADGTPDKGIVDMGFHYPIP